MGVLYNCPNKDWGSETAYYYVEVLPGETGTTYHGVTYKEHHRDVSPGTGYSVSKEDKYAITGFTYKEGTENGGRYNNAKFYYTRNSYNIVFINNGATEKTQPMKYEQSLSGVSQTDNKSVFHRDRLFLAWFGIIRKCQQSRRQ